MTTRGERLHERLGRLAVHAVRGYRAALYPRPDRKRVPNRRTPSLSTNSRFNNLISARRNKLKNLGLNNIGPSNYKKRIESKVLGRQEIYPERFKGNYLAMVNYLHKGRLNNRNKQKAEALKNMSVNELTRLLNPNTLRALVNRFRRQDLK